LTYSFISFAGKSFRTIAMENNCEVKPRQGTFKENLKTWNFWRPYLSVTIGAIAGFSYYHFVGCTSGTCAITSSRFMSTIWGGALGYFLVNSPCARGRC
jgi:hypothetical protein